MESERKDVLIISAEASSNLYAQRILEIWKESHPRLQAFGVGSSEMEALGFERLGKAEEMALVGAAEIIEHYSDIKKVFNRILEEVKARKPRFALLLDYPEFNIRLAKELKKMNVFVFYYISPQIWAWRKNRVFQMKAYCEKVFLIFPFEIPFYEKHKVPFEFVGHPILDELRSEYLDGPSIENERLKCGIQPHEIVLGLMPGSRKGELQRHFQIQLEVARRISQRVDNLKVLILCAPSFDKTDLYPFLEDFKIPFIIMKTDPFKMISLTDLILAASGTATLMVGLLEKPMVIMYRMKWLTGIIAKLLVKGVRFFGITNLILEKEVSPERFQNQASIENLENLVFDLISKKDLFNYQKQELKLLKEKLGNKGATLRVVKLLDQYL
ncbi:MAG: lipid-A-disaccharide synthase [Deltaproteobacteria bacterium]|jgi:lipid-A-disaccharide synthase|nr:lipid-A-disaccharide synthase [Deltaproteobacteria bacterium]